MTARPLAGIGVLVTRPVHQSDELIAAIVAGGGSVHRFPLIDILPRDPAELSAEAAALQPSDFVIFVSANAVHHGHRALGKSSAKIAAIGPATAAALEGAGSQVDVVPAAGFDSEHLLAADSLKDVAGKTITIVRGESGRELLAETLRHRGATVQYLSAYRREAHQFSEAELTAVEKAWCDGAIDAVMVMSVATLESLLQSLPPACVAELPNTRLVGPSERVIQTALGRLPGANCILSPGPGAADMVGALVESLHKDPDPGND